MSDIRTKAATDAYRRNWDACFGKGPNTRTTWSEAMPHEHVEPPFRVLYLCPRCEIEVWDADTGNTRRCETCGDSMLTVSERIKANEAKDLADFARRIVAAQEASGEPITRNRGPAVESFPSSSPSLPVARCPECNRPWSPEP